jgi:cell wall-associated NlpC family hydrolase
MSRFGDNRRVPPLPPRRRRLCLALLTAGLLASAPLAIAQQAPGRSLTATATAAVRGVAASAWGSAQTLTSFALGLIGVDYKYGGETPETGLDCSGLVRYVFQNVTGVTLPRTAREMSSVGDKVALDDLEPGDLVFFNTRRFAFSHVGIYLGDNRFIHAPARGREVEVATFDKRFWQKRFNGARRLIGAVPGLVPSFVSEARAAPVDFAPATPAPAAPLPATPDTQP